MLRRRRRRRRRRLLLGAAAAGSLAACRRAPEQAYEGTWLGGQRPRGHQLRDLEKLREIPPAVHRRGGVLVVGSGVAGLACARGLTHAGRDDVHVFDLEDQAGGNSRAHRMGGMACPLGAHYLPVPGERDTDLLSLLQAFGVCQFTHGRHVFDERYLCHSPQERLYIHGQWQEGLLPVHGQSAQTLDEYQRFSQAVVRVSKETGFSLPTHLTAWGPSHAALDAITFSAWLNAQGFRNPSLLAYLDYCCRDDFGAGVALVSAWSGLHYFASRHGFQAPGMEAGESEAVLTWPQGNAWLTERMAAALGDRLHTGMLAVQVTPGRHEVVVDFWSEQAQRMERWVAPHVVMATPLFVSARVVATPHAALMAAEQQLRYAPWLVANLLIDTALDDALGAPASWDNVLHGSPMLGYVDAMHQSTRPHPGPTVLTAYWALGGDSMAQLQAQRTRLLQAPWTDWAESVVADLSRPHPDLRDKLERVDLMRYGHAMCIPMPGVRGSAALRALSQSRDRLSFAHADLSAYSAFEEAFSQGLRAASELMARPSAVQS